MEFPGGSACYESSVTAVAQVQFLGWELPHASGTAKKTNEQTKTKQSKCKERIKKKIQRLITFMNVHAKTIKKILAN